MDRTNVTRWTIATLLVVGLAWLDTATGNHRGVTMLLFGILIFVYLYGGHGKPGGSSAGQPGNGEVGGEGGTNKATSANDSGDGGAAGDVIAGGDDVDAGDLGSAGAWDEEASPR